MYRISGSFIVISHQSVPTTAQDQPIGRRGHHHLTTVCGALPSRSHGTYHQRSAPIVSLILPGKLAACTRCDLAEHTHDLALFSIRHVALHRQALRDRIGFPKHHTVSQRFAGYPPFAKEPRQGIQANTQSRLSHSFDQSSPVVSQHGQHLSGSDAGQLIVRLDDAIISRRVFLLTFN